MSTETALKFYDVYNRQDVGLLDELLAAEYVGTLEQLGLVWSASATRVVTNAATADDGRQNKALAVEGSTASAS